MSIISLISSVSSISNRRIISSAVLALSLVGGCASDPEAQLDDEASADQALIGSPVNLGTAGRYAILSQTGISTVPPSAITGDMGVSPIGDMPHAFTDAAGRAADVTELGGGNLGGLTLFPVLLDDRYWYAGTFQWWGDISYARGAEHDAGWSLELVE
jgi:hypothetical protein